jgi:hypothetical protein
VSTATASPKSMRRKVIGFIAVVLILALIAVHQAFLTAGVALAGLLVVAFVVRWRWRRHRAGGASAARQRRKYQGAATRRDLRRHLSVRAARRKSAVTAPDLHPAYAPVVIGRAQRKLRTVAGTWSDSYLLLAPPQTMKTALISCWAADAPGALLATSSRGEPVPAHRHPPVAPRRSAGPERGRCREYPVQFRMVARGRLRGPADSHPPGRGPDGRRAP